MQIFFDIQKPFYYPGEKIIGSIYIDFFESINCNSITIISKGKQYIKINRKNISREVDEYEDSLYEENEDEDKIPEINNKNFENIDEKKIVFKYEKKIKINNNYLSKGKYTFPFEMDIPDNIPASFLYIDNNIYCEIIYTLKIKFNGMNIYDQAIPIIIRQKEKLFNYPQVNEYKKTLGECCWERGETTIKISPLEKYSLSNNKINLNILINNEKCGLPGTPLNLELYKKIIVFPKDRMKKIRKTKLVGKAKGIKSINPRKNFNEDISIKIKTDKIIPFNKEKTRAYKYFKNKNIIEYLTTSIKSDLVVCEYDVYVESQFFGWFKEELGVFNKLLVYPPEKGILTPNMEYISQEFLNSLVIKKIFLNSENKDDDIIIGKDNKNNKENKINKKGKEKKEKIVKNKKNKNNEEYNDYDKENKENINMNNKNINMNNKNIKINNKNININNKKINIDDINENFNINEFKKMNILNKQKRGFNYYDDENEDLDKFKKKLGKDYFDEHDINDDFLDNTLDD